MASSSRQPTAISRKSGAIAAPGSELQGFSVDLEELDDLQMRASPLQNAKDLTVMQRANSDGDIGQLEEDDSTKEQLPPHLLRSSCSELFLELFSRYYACGLEKQTAFFDFLEARGFVDSTGKPQFVLNQLGQRITFLSKMRFPTYRPSDDDSDSEEDEEDDDEEEEILQDDDDDAESRSVTRSSSASNGLSTGSDRRWASSLSFACGALGGESQRRSFFWNYIRFPQQTHYPRSYFRFARAFRQRVLLQEALHHARSSKLRSPAVGDWAWEFSGPQPFPVIPGVVDGDILCTIFSGMMPENIVYYRCPSASARIYIAVDIASSFPILPRRLLRLANDPKRFTFWLSTRFSYSLPRFIPAFPVIVGYFRTIDGDIEITRTEDQTTLLAKKNGVYLGTVWFNPHGVIRRIHTLL